MKANYRPAKLRQSCCFRCTHVVEDRHPNLVYLKCPVQNNANVKPANVCDHYSEEDNYED
jgi:hypothetical protein